MHNQPKEAHMAKRLEWRRIYHLALFLICTVATAQALSRGFSFELVAGAAGVLASAGLLAARRRP